MDDLDHMAFELFLIIGAFCLGAILESRDSKRRKLPPPDARTHRTYWEHR